MGRSETGGWVWWININIYMSTYIGRGKRDHVHSGVGAEEGGVVRDELADGAAQGVACLCFLGRLNCGRVSLGIGMCVHGIGRSYAVQYLMYGLKQEYV